MERPCIVRHGLVGVSVPGEIRPLVNRDGDRLCFERGYELQILLVMLVLGPDLDGRGSLKLDERQRWVDRHLFLELDVGVHRAGRVVVLADHVDVVQATENHLARPIRGGQVVGDVFPFMRRDWSAPSMTSGIAPGAISVTVGSTFFISLANISYFSSNCGSAMEPI